MDRLESLGNQLSQITLYDIKSYYNQAKNMVLNVSEMEAKVREATNDEPWGASSTLMQEIAQGTFNFQQFNEIMPCIYSRFMEKEARQWREIYKALQLLEYIIKHGSERVVDDARSHLSTIKMLRNFHYIDDKGKDQGINVRNRASEISTLLSDLEKVRAERRKAKANRSKYVGVGNDGGLGGYSGFGSDSAYSFEGGYGGNSDYYNGGGGGSTSFRDETTRRGYEEYDAGEYEAAPASHRSNSQRSPISPISRDGGSFRQTRPAPEAKEKEKEKPVLVDDLLGDWGDDSGFGDNTPEASKDKALPTVASPSANDGDDFADFQSAPTSPPAAPLAFSKAPIPTAIPPQTNPKPNVFEFLSQTQAPVPAAPVLSGVPAQQQAPLQAQPARPNYFSSGSIGSNFMQPMHAALPNNTSTAARLPPAPAQLAQPAKSSSSNFDDLWSLGLGASGKSAPPTASGAGVPSKSMKDLEKEKAQAGIWGVGQGHSTQSSVSSSGVEAFGSFGGASGGGDDLLL